MSTIQELFQQAQLSEAAYADFIDSQTGNVFVDLADIKIALIASGFSKDPNDPTQSAQATTFLQNWRVIDQYDNSEYGGLVGTGFSATVFERLDNGVGTGEYSLAIRGSQDAADFLADTGLIATDDKWGRSHF